MTVLLPTLTTAMMLALLPAPASEDVPKDVKDKIDAIVIDAYQAAAAKLPCKVGTTGKMRMLRWQAVDRCLNETAGKADWGDIARRLDSLHAGTERLSKGDFAAAVEASFAAHALPYNKVFSVKDARALLPLTNSLLKFLPADSLHDLPVFDRAGNRVGTFAGIYAYERMGGLASANTYRLMLFQYEDRNGNVQSATDKLLLDSFGVPWKDAHSQSGFRLTSEKLDLNR